MLVVLVLPLLLASGGDADLVLLKSGRELRGRIVFEDDDGIVLRANTRDTRIEREDIERFESRARNLDDLLDNDRKWHPHDGGELELLAAQAKEMGLAGEGEVYHWRMLLRGAENEDARRFLGHTKRGRAWVVPVGGRWVPWEKRLELAKDWGSAWELTSLHYELRSNLPLGQTLDALLDVERLYRAFYDLFGAELELYDVCRTMRMHLHADDASFPEIAGEAGRYDPQTDILSIRAVPTLEFGVVAHEMTHQLLHNTAFRERNDDGCIPPWVNEGLAEYMAAGVQSTAPLVWVAGRPQTYSFREHARAKDPFDLTRVLSFSTSDYDASSGRMLKYAQSYTLVHFLLHGLQGKHRAGFIEYLREVYRGKGSSTDLKGALGVEWKQLQKDWDAYVRIPR